MLAPGESRTGQITIHLPATQPAGIVPNTATVRSDTPDPDPTDNDATASLNVVLVADLKITKTVETNPIVAGAPVTYRIDVVNQGPSIAPNALISDPLASNVTFTSASAGCIQTTTEEARTVIACHLGTLAVGATGSATITVTPLAGATGTLTNTATAGSDALDASTGDNTATVTSPITTEGDVGITLTGPATVDAGGTATFQLGYLNNGPSDVTNVLITDTLAAGLTLQPPPGCTFSTQLLTCSIASLPAGASGQIDLTVTIDPNTAIGTVLTQQATIAADQVDTNPANDTAAISSTVASATDVGVTVSADTPIVTPGGVAGFTVVVTNHGPLTATVVTLTNALPGQVTDPADPQACTFAGNVATCALGTMAVGATTTIHFRGTVPTSTAVGTRLTDSASVTRAETDTVPANDHSSASMTVVATPPPEVLPAHLENVDNLAFTGENPMPAIELAALLIALGAVALAVGGRPRRRTDRSS
jgi:uncharacterized repeat protein (TIGR01451 family)